MNRQILHSLLSAGVLVLSGCLSYPTAQSGPGTVTIPNTNPRAIFNAAEMTFSNAGFTRSASHFPHSITFEQRQSPGRKMAVSFDTRASSYRVILHIARLPGTHDFRLMPRVDRMDHRRVADVGRRSQIVRVWSGRFQSLVVRTRTRAANAGPAH